MNAQLVLKWLPQVSLCPSTDWPHLNEALISAELNLSHSKFLGVLKKSELCKLSGKISICNKPVSFVFYGAEYYFCKDVAKDQIGSGL